MMKKNRSIKSVFYVVLSLIVIISVIMQFVIFYTLNRINDAQQDEVMYAVEEHISNTIEQRLEVTKSILNRFYRKPEVLDLLKSANKYEKKIILNQIAKQADLLGAGSEEVFYIAVFDESGAGYKLINNVSDNELKQLKVIRDDFRRVSENTTNEDVVEYCDFFQYNNYEAGELYICSVCPVYEYDFETFENIDCGTIIVACKLNTQKLFLEIGNISEIEINITNRHTGKENFITFKRDGVIKTNEKRNNHSLEIANTRWDISECWQIGEGYKLDLLQSVFLAETVLLLLGIILMENRLRKLLISPLGEIVNFLSKYNMVSREKQLNIKGSSEINIIAENINVLTDNIYSVTHRLIENQQRLYEAELMNVNTKVYALQSQVNPHFLCNVLECMRGIALQKDLHEVAEASLSISEMMRYILEMSEITTLENELGIIEKYINIMKIRYPEMFQYSIEVLDELKTTGVIKMSIQPIVENSFINGRFFKNKKGILKIKVYKENEDLVISIYDNGIGFSEEKKAEVEKNLKAEMLEFKSQNSIGLVNVNSRIRLKWGEKYGLKIFSEEGKFSEIILRMPIEINEY